MTVTEPVTLLSDYLLRLKAAAAPWCVAGIGVAFAAAAVQLAELQLHPQFNHNDLYHVVQALAFWLLYRGGLLLDDRTDQLQ